MTLTLQRRTQIAIKSRGYWNTHTVDLYADDNGLIHAAGVIPLPDGREEYCSATPADANVTDGLAFPATTAGARLAARKGYPAEKVEGWERDVERAETEIRKGFGL